MWVTNDEPNLIVLGNEKTSNTTLRTIFFFQLDNSVIVPIWLY